MCVRKRADRQVPAAAVEASVFSASLVADSGRPDVYGDPPGIRAQPVRGSMGKYRVEYEGTPSGRPGVPPDAIGLAAMAALLPPELGLDLDPRDDAGGGRRGEASQGRPGSPSRRPTSARPVTTRVDTSPPRSPYRPGTSHGRAMSPSSSAAGASPRKSRRISGRWAEVSGDGATSKSLGREWHRLALVPHTRSLPTEHECHECRVAMAPQARASLRTSLVSAVTSRDQRAREHHLEC